MVAARGVRWCTDAVRQAAARQVQDETARLVAGDVFQLGLGEVHVAVGALAGQQQDLALPSRPNLLLLLHSPRWSSRPRS